MTLRLNISINLIFCGLFMCLSARSDGGFVSNGPDQDLLEPDQIGLIVYDGMREDLYLKVNFQEANSQKLESLGWILATPSAPEATEADDELFVELMDFTRPYGGEDPLDPNCFCIGAALGAASADFGDDSVDIMGTTVAGAFEITTVAANGAAPLRNWITDQNFYLADEADSILDFYIEKNWVFLAVRIDLEQAREAGALKTLKLSFFTEKPVFPFRISAINGLGLRYYYDGEYDTNTDVLLYLVSKHSLTASNRSVSEKFDQPFTSEDLDGFPALRAAMPSNGRITKLHFSSAPENMDDDIYFAPAAKSASMVFSPGPTRRLHGYLFAALIGLALYRSWKRGRR